MTAGQRRRPANMATIVAVNQGRAPLTRSLRDPAPVPPERAADLVAGGHVVVDTRSSRAFGAGHAAGSIHVHLSSDEFEQRVGWVVPEGAPILLLCSDDAAARRCLHRLAFVAMDARVAGVVTGGMEGWEGAGLPVETVPQMQVAELRRRLEEGSIAVLDVREQEEWDEGHIEGALFAPYGSLAEGTGDGAPGSVPGLDGAPAVAVVCATGKRSSTAISLLRRRGVDGLHNVEGGMEAWWAAGLPGVS